MGAMESIKNALYSFVVWTGVVNVAVDILHRVMHALGKDPPGGESNYEVADAKGKKLVLCEVNGKIYPPFGVKQLQSVSDLKIRSDDVILCGYPKTGAHWMYEILYMLVHRNTKLSKYGKELGGFFDCMPQIMMDSLYSPRVLNSHLIYDELPREAREKKTKIVLTTRNPKDTAVSFYSHHLNFNIFYGYDGEFADWFELFINGNVDYGDYFDYWLDWERVMKRKDHPILMVSYEDLKANTVKCVLDIASFLEIQITEQFAKEVVSACDFKKMKEKRGGETSKEGNVYRKGKVGDWRNWMTDEMSNTIDKRWAEKMMDCTYQPALN